MRRILRSPLVIALTRSLALLSGCGGARDTTVMGPLSHTGDDHLPSGPWYIYEYPDRAPKLLERVKPAYVPEYEQ